MNILDHPQRSPEWHAARESIFTASETGEYVAEEKKLRLSIKEIKELIPTVSLPSKALAADWEAALRKAMDVTPLLTWTEGTVKARQNLIAKKLAAPFYAPTGPMADLAGSAWLLQLREKEERALDNNAAIQRGVALEDWAREAYEKLTGFAVSEVGLCVSDAGGSGCSPDGMVTKESNWQIPAGYVAPANFLHGTEIKCPIPETHAKYLLSGTLPDEYRPQVHHSLAVTGLDRWDFFSFCPGMPALHVIVKRDEYTGRFKAGLESLVAELGATRAKLSALWKAQHGKEAA